MPDNRGEERSKSAEEYAKSLEKNIRDNVSDEVRGCAVGPRAPGPGMVIAVLIIGAGVLLFLDNLGIFHIYNIWRLWPVAVIGVGFSKLFESRGAGGFVWGVVVIAVGALFLMNNLDIWHISWGLIWPLGLVGLGISMLLNALDRKGDAKRTPPWASRGMSTSDTLREWATFSGIKKRLHTVDFQGGEMIAVFGGIEVDLREANISPGKEVVVDANATFGGIELRVPYSWEVVVRGMGIFGGYEDKTVPPRREEGVTPPRLLVTGYAVFGGVSIEN